MNQNGKLEGLMAVILAGGNSRRMGQDKALLEADGQTLLERVHAAAAGLGLQS